jgi:hypothetical protein
MLCTQRPANGEHVMQQKAGVTWAWACMTASRSLCTIQSYLKMDANYIMNMGGAYLQLL